MLFFAPAKINLALHILGKRPDGYHEVDMILQSISLFDRLEMEEIAEGIELSSNSSTLSMGPDNLIYKAALLLQERCGVMRGVRIFLDKQIPTEAGLAGGSSDGAATLRGLNQLWDLGLSRKDLEKLGAQLGSDVPFCIAGGTARGTGRGEVVAPLASCPLFHVLIVKPPVGVSTPAAYQGYRDHGVKNPPDVEAMVKAIELGDRDEIRSQLGNAFEEWVPFDYPVIGEIMERLKAVGATGVGMSGSGPTVFALGDTEEDVKRWQQAVSDLGATWICTTLNEK